VRNKEWELYWVQNQIDRDPASLAQGYPDLKCVCMCVSPQRIGKKRESN
jgi:hypothetical protein